MLAVGEEATLVLLPDCFLVLLLHPSLKCPHEHAHVCVFVFVHKPILGACDLGNAADVLKLTSLAKSSTSVRKQEKTRLTTPMTSDCSHTPKNGHVC